MKDAKDRTTDPSRCKCYHIRSQIRMGRYNEIRYECSGNASTQPLYPARLPDMLSLSLRLSCQRELAYRHNLVQQRAHASPVRALPEHALADITRAEAVESLAHIGRNASLNLHLVNGAQGRVAFQA